MMPLIIATTYSTLYPNMLMSKALFYAKTAYCGIMDDLSSIRPRFFSDNAMLFNNPVDNMGACTSFERSLALVFSTHLLNLLFRGHSYCKHDFTAANSRSFALTAADIAVYFTLARRNCSWSLWAIFYSFSLLSSGAGDPFTINTRGFLGFSPNAHFFLYFLLSLFLL